MEQSIFINKEEMPDNSDLTKSLGNTYEIWKNIKDYVTLKYPNSIDEWNYTNNGWSFRMKDKKRAIIYFLPRDKYFKAAFVFGQKATDIIMQSNIANAIKTELSAARVYAEGRGIRIDVLDNSVIDDIKTLIDIKLSN